MKIAICTATERGKLLATRLQAELDCDMKSVNDDVFSEYDALIYICAVGIAVRKIAPYIKSKLSDPAVVVCDEAGKFAVSLLSGHIGGANALCKEVAAIIDAIPVITTATDVFKLPEEPKNIVIGIGCRKGISADDIERAVTITLYHHGISVWRICAVASIDVKRNEQGLIAFAKLYELPITFYSADELNGLEGEFNASDFVSETVGVDNVCERAAALCGEHGKLVIGKTAKDGITVAAFEKEIV